jgi:hypothetical protein
VNEKRCSGTNQDGSPCRATGGFVLSDGRCISHSVEHRQAKLLAVTKGGLAARQAFDRAAPDPILTSKRKIEARLAWVSGSVRRGEVSTTEAFLHLAVARASWEVIAQDRRLKVLERVEPDRPPFSVHINLGSPSRSEISNGHGGRGAVLALEAETAEGPIAEFPERKIPKPGEEA